MEQLKNQSDQINELATALSKMQQQVRSIPKNKTAIIPMKSGGKFQFSYADLCGILDAVRKPLTDNGLSITQLFANDGVNYQIVTTLLHSSGQWLKSFLPISVNAVDIKQLGSQITYSRRYALASILGVCADDDDEGGLEGNAITSPAPEPMRAPQIITKDEAGELEAMLIECDDSFISNVKNYLKGLNINSFHQLPRANYAAIRKRIVNKIAELESEVAHV